MDSSKVYYTREYSYVLYMMTVQFYNYLAAAEVQPVATPTHKFTRARYSFDRCCTTSGTNNRAILRLSGTRDKFYKSGTDYALTTSILVKVHQQTASFELNMRNYFLSDDFRICSMARAHQTSICTVSDIMMMSSRIM